MSARVSPQTGVIQGSNPDGDAQDAVVNRFGMLRTEDLSIHDLLCQVLLELKIQNVHLAEITGNEISASDTEEEEECE